MLVSPSSLRSGGSIACIVALVLAPGAHAATPKPGTDDLCKRAKEQLGSVIERGMTADQCQQALDIAEEERWQLWIDIATANELAGDLERAALSLDKFLVAADRRPRPLSAQWVVMRDEARQKVARMDAEVMKTKGRVTIVTTPEGAEATFVGGGAFVPDKVPKTPVSAYFEPGTHTVRVRHPATEAVREVSFTVAVGSAVRLDIDLRPNARPDTAVAEAPGKTVLGQDENAAPTPAPEVPETSFIEVPGEDPDPEGPPVRDGGASLGESLGTVAIAAGTASLAVGVTFALIASGLDDEAVCAGAACDRDVALRERVRRDADVAWDRMTGTMIVGGLLVVGGVLAIVLTDDAPTASYVTPWVGPDGGGLSGQLRF